MARDGGTEVPKRRQGVRLRFVLAFALIAVGIVPSLTLLFWLHVKAADIQINDVAQRSFVLSKTLARFIESHLNAFRNSLDTMSMQYSLSGLSPTVSQNASDQGMTAICLLSGARRPQDVTVISGAATCLPRDQDRMWRDIKPRVPSSGGGVVFSEVLLDSEGYPAVFGVLFRAGLPIAAARMSLEPFRELRRLIVFGEKGHAAIIDHKGNIVSHPRPDWEAAVKNIAKVEPVARMIAGESGMSRFLSPAANLKMVAGFSAIPRYGWGVMVPQPERELAFHAEVIRKGGEIALVIGLLMSCALAWWLAGRMTAPIAKVEEASRLLASDEPSIDQEEESTHDAA